ncbi:MAG: hypothetical protein Q9225_006762, partial [Loekoesia sp. 1 TL-2023]
MFFVNARPCSLPQFAKAFNEVYKSYNISQSPFVFANIIIDTKLFEKQDQTVPQTQLPHPKLPAFKQLTVHRQDSGPIALPSFASNETQTESSPDLGDESPDDNLPDPSEQIPQPHMSLIEKFAGRDVQPRVLPNDEADKLNSIVSKGKQTLVRKLGDSACYSSRDEINKESSAETSNVEGSQETSPNPVVDFNTRTAEQQAAAEENETRPSEEPASEAGTHNEEDIRAIETTPTKPALGVVQNAFDRMRPRRQSPQVATITIGTKTTTALLGSSPPGLDTRRPKSPPNGNMSKSVGNNRGTTFSSSIQAFNAPGTFSQAPSHNTPVTSSRRAPDSVISSERESNFAETPVEGTLSNEVSSGESAGGDKEKKTVDSDTQSPLIEDSDDEYLDDEDRKAKQDAKVADLIQQAEKKSAVPSQDNLRRAGKILHGRGLKDSTTSLLQILDESVTSIENRLRSFERDLQKSLVKSLKTTQLTYFQEVDPEKKLSLTVSKDDFSRMSIIGQFNLGFILAVRPSTSSTTDEELFIIDQHASDEKFNFERLQASTTVQNQRLVKPKALDLTAIEEEIIIENNAALVENGFVVEVDLSGDSPVGQRCKLISLPMSREVTFDLSDLEELIALLGESPPTKITSEDGRHQKPLYIPRPSKVRQLFAMRACRSSVMIGKTLQKRQMESL